MIASPLDHTKENNSLFSLLPTHDTDKIHAHEMAVAVVFAGLAVHNDPFYFAQAPLGFLAASGYGVMNAVALKLGYLSGVYMADEIVESVRKTEIAPNIDSRTRLCRAFRTSCAVMFGTVTMLFSAPQTYDVMKKASQAVPGATELKFAPPAPDPHKRLAAMHQTPVLGWEG